MSTENSDAYIEQAKAKLAEGFQGEEDIEGASTPQKDLLSACVIGVLSIGAMVLAWQMPDPGRSVFTHPGLLPFLTGLTMLAMAFGLAARALREGGAANLTGVFAKPTDPDERDYARRAWLLIGLIVALIVAVDFVSFRIRIPIGSFEFKISSFEIVAIPIVTVIMKIFWRKSWLRCLLAAAVTAMLLAAAFRWGFKIPMPGVD
ncbi:MAG: tripartite tricarboxylate transporter TctB family protein [Betaproteobacteria bacterium]|nr:tripartite tricarboxylate transporter TctB family protein [Gammaproteobacteria bacterium]MDH3437665.1 tripartite tricarboxylate transporter TctB family protein [Betaproteobacteria bacterium]